MSGDDFTKAEHIAATHVEAVRKREEEQQRAEAQREQEEAEAAAVAEAEAASGPTYWSIVNQGLQNTLARQQAAIAAARAQQAAELANAQQAAAARAEQAAALARAQQSAATQQVSNQAALSAQRSISSANPGTLLMALRDECIAASAKLDPTGAGMWFFFTNRCSQLVVIKEFTQGADGSWRGGEDCRSNGQWVEAYENTTGTARYIAWAQFVNSCSQELFLQWPPDPS
jgi:hypothetical protein